MCSSGVLGSPSRGAMGSPPRGAMGGGLKLQLQAAGRRRARCLRSAAINAAVLLVLAADLSSKCSGYTTVLHWVELCMAGVCGANLVRVAAALLTCRSAPAPPPLPPASPASPAPSTDDDTTVESLSLSLSPRGGGGGGGGWHSAPPSPVTATPPSPPSPNATNRDRFIADRQTLHEYLSECASRSPSPVPGAGGLAPRPPPPPPPYRLAAAEPERGPEQAAAPLAAALWGRLHLDPMRLTQFNLNLRLWLHVTILERLVREMESLDAALSRLGLGAALETLAAERLRALARSQHAPPSLAQLLPFLEPFADRRYVVRRIRELAAGGCLSAYRWDGGGNSWDDSQPTDAELILHLLAAYLDAQLPPSAGPKAFSSQHLSCGAAVPPRGLAIHRVTSRPPHYVLGLDGHTLELSRGRNNLLHTLLVFIAGAARHEPPALRRLHLGPAGLNMLWIIGR